MPLQDDLCLPGKKRSPAPARDKDQDKGQSQGQAEHPTSTPPTGGGGGGGSGSGGGGGGSSLAALLQSVAVQPLPDNLLMPVPVPGDVGSTDGGDGCLTK